MADALEDPQRLAELVAAELPAPVRRTPAARLYVAERTARLRAPAIGRSLRCLAEQVALADRTALAAVTTRLLVLGCEGDLLHPAVIARELAAAVPHAQLHVFPEVGPLWTDRKALREEISGFLNA